MGHTDWWHEGPVDRSSEHFELRYGDASKCAWDECRLVALASRGVDGLCDVEFLIGRDDPQNSEIIEDVVGELNLYLVELRTPERPDPWKYLQYHCTTTSNVYSRVHWSYIPQQTMK